MSRCTRVCGTAMIAVLLIISIFFIIAVAISSIVTLQARNVMELTMGNIAFYIADLGIRYATPRVMYRFFMENGAASTQEIYETPLNIGHDEYSGNLIIEFYDVELLPAPVDTFTHREKITAIGQLIRVRDNLLLAQRQLYAEVYLKNTFPASPGTVTASIKNYYEKNR